MLRILLVEDNYGDRVATENLLMESFAEVRIEWLGTESAFRRWLQTLDGAPPDIVILDIKLPWTKPAPVLEPAPADYPGNDEAGLRCYELLRGDPRCEQVPVVLLTHTKTLPLLGQHSVEYVGKTERNRLNEVVRRMLSPQGTA